MSSRLARLARSAVSAVASRLSARERLLFDLLCAAGVLGAALPINSNLRETTGRHDPRRKLEPLLARLRREKGSWTAACDGLARRLTRELARRGDKDHKPLRILVAYAGGALAPDCVLPADPHLRAAFGVVLRVFPALFDSRVRPLGRLKFADPARLLRETRSNRRRTRKASGRRPGPLGRELAMDARLMDLLSRTLRKTVTPGFEARYIFYEKPGDYFWPHPDDPKYQANLLLCLERRKPADGGRPSCFFSYGSDGTMRRIDLKPGEALVAEARGVVHGREPLRRGEKVTLLSIELKCATRSFTPKSQRSLR